MTRTPEWVHALTTVPFAALLVIVGIGFSWWVAGFIFGPPLALVLAGFIIRRRLRFVKPS